MSSSAINLAGMLAPTQFRNKIINGNFDIWQRGNTFGSFDGAGGVTLAYGGIANGVGGTGANSLARINEIRVNPYVSPVAQKGGAQADGDIIKDQAITADRWRIGNRSGMVGSILRKEFDWSDSANLLPAGSSPARYYIELNVEAKPDGNDVRLSQRIEDVTIFNNEKITISFYAKYENNAISNANRISVALHAFTKSNGSNLASGGSSHSPAGSPLAGVLSNYFINDPTSTYLTGDTKVLTTSWKKFSWTITIPQMAGMKDGNGNYVKPGEGFWHLDIRPDSSLEATWLGQVHIAQVQVEKRDDTTEFELLPPGIELQRCQRYFQKSLNLEDEPGSDYSSVGAGQAAHATNVGQAVSDVQPFPNGGHIADDAVPSNQNSSFARAFNMWGVLANTVGSGQGTDPIKFHSPMRDTPEVFIYNPDNGTRGSVFFIEGTLGVIHEPIDWIEGIGTNQCSVPVAVGPSDMNGIRRPMFAYYWTADAEL